MRTLRCFSRCHRTCEVVSVYGIGGKRGKLWGRESSPADELGPWRTDPSDSVEPEGFYGSFGVEVHREYQDLFDERHKSGRKNDLNRRSLGRLSCVTVVGC